MTRHALAFLLLLLLPARLEAQAPLAERLEANVALLRSVDVEPWLAMFAAPAQRGAAPVAEPLGHWLEAAALSGDPALRARAGVVIARLAAMQEPTGYLGVTDPVVRDPSHPIRAAGTPEMFAMLRGLLAASDACGDATALATAKKLADYLLAHVAPGKAEFWLVPGEGSIAGPANQLGLHAAILAGPVARLGDPKYLAWSRWVVGSLDRWAGRDVLASLARGDVPADVPPAALHRVLLALLALRDDGLTRTVRNVWGRLASSRASLTDTAVVASWLLLSQALLEATGDVACAEAVERTLWNPLLAAQSTDGWHATAPFAGTRTEASRTDVLAGARALAGVRRTLAIAIEDGAAICQYVPLTVQVTLPSGNALAIQQRTAYPTDGAVHIVVEPKAAERFVLQLRIPAWCADPTATVNGQAIEGLEPGQFARIERTWRSGDRIELSFPMAPRWLAEGGRRALARGPLVYALDAAWCDPVNRRRLAAASAVSTEPPTPTDTPAGAFGPAYLVRIVLPGGRRALAPMLPFANRGMAPATPSDACVVWLPEAASGRFRTLDLRPTMNVHGSDGRALFTTALARDESFVFPRYGTHTLGGVPFDLVDPGANGGRGLLILHGGSSRDLAARYPTRAAAPVGTRCRALHVLGGVAGWGHPATKRSGRWGDLTVRIRYENARTQEVRWRNGEHLADYSTRSHVPGSRHALDLDGKQLRTLRIPTNPDSPVTRVEFLDNGTPLAPVIAALTAELP
ncbi:glycoside hydrolase family 127 protein [bacterium]|nr:glycoside hydrolase family 127 protein [bacterium]